MTAGIVQSWRSRRIFRRQEQAYRRMWQTFVRYPHLADGRHDDEAWRAHSGRFAACLIRIPASALQPNLNTFREAVGPLGLSRLHPDHFLHIMVQEIGFVTRNPTTPDELSLDRFDELGSALGSALNDIEQFDVVVRGVNSFEDAAFLEVHDGGRCQMLHKRLREVAAVPLIPRYAFLPHITIAHYLGVFDSMPIVQALQPFRESEFGIVRISEVEIVTFRVDIDYPPVLTTRKLRLADPSQS